MFTKYYVICSRGFISYISYFFIGIVFAQSLRRRVLMVNDCSGHPLYQLTSFPKNIYRTEMWKCCFKVARFILSAARAQLT